MHVAIILMIFATILELNIAAPSITKNQPISVIGVDAYGELRERFSKLSSPGYDFDEWKLWSQAETTMIAVV